MAADIVDLTDEQASALTIELIAKLGEAQGLVELHERRVAGIRKLLEAVAELYPSVEDHLPDDFDGLQLRPRGAAAVERILREHVGRFYTVSGVVELLDARDWLPQSSNPANAVRTALERLHARGEISKANHNGRVVYGHGQEEEPF